MEVVRQVAALAAGSPGAALADAFGLAALVLLIGLGFAAAPG